MNLPHFQKDYITSKKKTTPSNSWKNKYKLVIINQSIKLYNTTKGEINMSCFGKFYKKEKLISRTLEIDESLYYELEKLSQEVYDASISKLVNASIEDIIKTENIQLYERKNTLYVTRSFLIRNSFWEGLCQLKRKYGVSIRLLVNISIRNVLIEEGILKENTNNFQKLLKR